MQPRWALSGYFSRCEGGTAFLSIRQERRLEACSTELPERKSRCSQDCRCHGTSHVCVDVAGEDTRFKVPRSAPPPAPAPVTEAATSILRSCQPLAWESAAAGEKYVAPQPDQRAPGGVQGQAQCSRLLPMTSVQSCSASGKPGREGHSQTCMGSFTKIAEGEAVPTAESYSRAGKPITWHVIIH